jgi:hypothetical protein
MLALLVNLYLRRLDQLHLSIAGGAPCTETIRMHSQAIWIRCLMEVMLRTILAIVIIGPAFAAGQLSGQFYLEKTTFAPGEPIFLYFQIVNERPQPETILSAEPYTF